MKINFSPLRADHGITGFIDGDVVVLDGERFDFGPLAEGAILPASAISSAHFSGHITRLGGVVHATLRCHHGPNAPHETMFPSSEYVEIVGVIDFPIYDAPADDTAPDQEVVPA